MKLFFERSQKQGRGSITFVLQCRLELTPDETKLVESYLDTVSALTNASQTSVWRLQGGGDRRESRNLYEILKAETDIHDYCLLLHETLAKCATYRGIEEVDFT